MNERSSNYQVLGSVGGAYSAKQEAGSRKQEAAPVAPHDSSFLLPASHRRCFMTLAVPPEGSSS